MPSEVNPNLDIKDNLRKLTPEEIAMHTGTTGYKMQEFQDATEKGMEAIRELLAPMVDKRFEETIERLSAIERKACDGDLILEERISAIEKHLAWFESKHDESIDRQADELHAMQKSISVLEGIQRGEGPEVYEPKLTDIGAIAAIASFGPVPEYVKAFIRHETEEAEKRKQRGTFECTPKNELILLSIRRGEEMHTEAPTCPAEAISWCEKVLDSMREG